MRIAHAYTDMIQCGHEASGYRSRGSFWIVSCAFGFGAISIERQLSGKNMGTVPATVESSSPNYVLNGSVEAIVGEGLTSTNYQGGAGAPVPGSPLPPPPTPPTGGGSGGRQPLSLLPFDTVSGPICLLGI